MNHCRLLIFALLLSITNANAQCPIPVYQSPDSVCPGVGFSIDNSASNANSWSWDFNTGDLDLIPNASAISGSGSLNYPGHMKIVKENGNYYGFVPNFGIDYITRYDFGSSLLNTPTVNNLNSNPLLSGFPYSMEMVRENGQWHGFLPLQTAGKLIRLDFDSITDTSPTYQDLGTSNLFGPFTIKIFEDYLFISNQLTEISRFTFNGSYLNNPSPLLPNIQTGSYNNTGIDIAFDCVNNTYTGFFGSTASDFIVRMDFGNSLSNSPTLTTAIQLNDPNGIQVVYEANKWHLFTVTDNNRLFHYESGSSLSNPMNLTFDSDLSGAFNAPKNIRLMKEGTDWIGLVPNTLFFNLSRLHFPQGNSVLNGASTLRDPNGITYPSNAGGIQYFNLTETLPDGNSIVYHDSVMVAILPPKADFNYNSVCTGDSIQFSDKSVVCTGNIVKWEWDFGDFSGENSQNPLHQYSSPGNYTVNLRIYTSNGDTVYATKNINIVNPPIADFAFTDSICKGVPVNFSNISTISTGSITSNIWNYGNGTTDNVLNGQNTYGLEGDYEISLYVESDQGCKDSISRTINIKNAPSGDFSVSNTCAGEITVFSNSSYITNGTITNNQWDFGDSNQSTLQNPVYQYPSSAGLYLVKLITTSDNGCTDTVNRQIEIADKPLPWFIVSEDTICEASFVQCYDSSFSATGGSNLKLIWDFGDGTTDSLNTNPIHTYQTPGNYTITLKVVSPTDCDSSIGRNICVLEKPTALFTGSNVCEGDTASFVDLSVSPFTTSIISWDWDFGDGGTSSNQNPIHHFDTAGQYNVTLTIINSIGCGDILTSNYTVNAIPVSDFAYGNLCSGYPMNFYDSSSVSNSGITGWNWNFGNSGSTSNLQNPVQSFTNPGSYLVSLEVTSNEGCKGDTSKFLLVKPSPQISIQSNNNCFGNGSAFNIIQSGTLAPIAVEWDFGDSTSSNSTQPLHFFNTSGQYTVNLTAIDTINGCISTAIRIHEVYPKPVASFVNPIACANSIFQIDNTSTISSGSIVENTWTFASTGSSNEVEPTIQISVPGLVFTSLSVTSDNGCIDSTTGFIKINPLPSALFTATPSYGAAPMNVSFQNQSSPNCIYHWDFNDGSPISTAATPSHIFTDPGNYNTKLSVTDSNNCTNQITQLIKTVSPYIDLAIFSADFYQNDEQWEISALLRNNGNIRIDNFRMKAQLENYPYIIEQFIDSIEPGAALSMIFKSSISKMQNEKDPDYLCVEILDVNGELDAIPENNKYCTTKKSDLSVLNIQPNPFDGPIDITIHSPANLKGNINLLDALGQKTGRTDYFDLQPGYNLIHLDYPNLSDGIYFISFSTDNKTIISKLIKK